jgi:hypothetical protein
MEISSLLLFNNDLPTTEIGQAMIIDAEKEYGRIKLWPILRYYNLPERTYELNRHQLTG